ncbi:c-type cytochrome [Methylobacterium sp. P31]
MAQFNSDGGLACPRSTPAARRLLAAGLVLGLSVAAAQAVEAVADGTQADARRLVEDGNDAGAPAQGCFRYSMNGKAPPLGDPALVALESYADFLARGAPVGENLPGRGYPELSEPPKLDLVAGAQVYAAKCALCHGGRGEGQATADGRIVFPPLWGPRAYNWGAGMSSIHNAAGFIKANMPFSQGGTLSDPEAWDVAAFIDGQERPQDPRFNGSAAETRKAHHDDPLDLYGQTVNGVVLGEHAPPSGTVPR